MNTGLKEKLCEVSTYDWFSNFLSCSASTIINVAWKIVIFLIHHRHTNHSGTLHCFAILCRTQAAFTINAGRMIKRKLYLPC